MKLEVTDEQIKRIVNQQVRWSRAASKAIEQEDEYKWDICIKSMRATTFTLSYLSEELEERVRKEVRECLVKIDGSEEKYLEGNAKWHEWQIKLRKKRGEK